MDQLRRCIVTLVAFICLFSTVRFQMSPQIACPRGSKFTLVAFVWLFSTMGFQMWPQCTWIRACILHSHIDCICLTFLHCVLLNGPSNCLHKMMQSHIGCICLISYLGPVLLLFLERLFWHCPHPHYDFQNLDPFLSPNKQAKGN